MNAVEVLTKARAILAERGVLRDGAYAHDETGPCCAYAAIAFALAARCNDGVMDYNNTDLSAADTAEHILRNTLRANPVNSDAQHGLIAGWNDATRTDAEVLEMFDKAITRAQQQLTETEN